MGMHLCRWVTKQEVKVPSAECVGVSTPRSLSVQNPQKAWPSSQGSAAVCLGCRGTPWSPSRTKKPLTALRVKKRRTLPLGLLPRDSAISLESKKTPVSSKGMEGGRRGSVSQPSDLNESKNTKSPHYHHYCQVAGNQLADTGQMDIRGNPRGQSGLRLHTQQRKRGRPVVSVPGAPLRVHRLLFASALLTETCTLTSEGARGYP